MKNVKKNGGFTLVELIVVIAILAILAAVAIPAYSGYIAKAEEANDLQLLGALNVAFNSACVENNIFNVKETMEGAEFVLTGSEGAKTISGLKLPGGGQATMSNVAFTDAQAAAILQSFDLYYGDNMETPFKVYVQIVYTEEGFKGFAADEVVADTGVFGTLFDKLKGDGKITSEQITAVNNSEFGKIGGAEMMDRVDAVTQYATQMGLSNTAASALLYGNMSAMATAMGYDMSDFDENSEDGVIAFYAWLDETTAQIATEKGDGTTYKDVEMQLLSNYTVIAAANATTGTSEELLAEVQKGFTGGELKDMMKDKNSAQDGLAKAGMMYGLYTAWANSLDENDPYKATAEANAADIDLFLNDVDNTRFVNEYLNGTDSTAKTDLEGYLAAMQIINSSVQNGDTSTVTDLMVNGYSDETLKNAVEGLLGQ